MLWTLNKISPLPWTPRLNQQINLGNLLISVPSRGLLEVILLLMMWREQPLLILQGTDQNTPPKSVPQGARGVGTNCARLTQLAAPAGVWASRRPCPTAGPVVPVLQPPCRGHADLDPPRAGNLSAVTSDKTQSFSAVHKITNSFCLIYLILGNIFNFCKSILMSFCSFIHCLHYYLIPAWQLPVQLVEHRHRSFCPWNYLNEIGMILE